MYENNMHKNRSHSCHLAFIFHNKYDTCQGCLNQEFSTILSISCQVLFLFEGKGMSYLTYHQWYYKLKDDHKAFKFWSITIIPLDWKMLIAKSQTRPHCKKKESFLSFSIHYVTKQCKFPIIYSSSEHPYSKVTRNHLQGKKKNLMSKIMIVQSFLLL